MTKNSLMTSLRPYHMNQTDGDQIILEAQGTQHELVLLGLGFSLQSSSPNRIFEMSFAPDKDKADVFLKLRDDGIAFSRGREWCPV